jgi:hypothetical protein
MNKHQTRAFERGNYCSAYETQDFEEAEAKHFMSCQGKGMREAFMCGFFSSYELDEAGGAREELEAARKLFDIK